MPCFKNCTQVLHVHVHVHCVYMYMYMYIAVYMYMYIVFTCTCTLCLHVHVRDKGLITQVLSCSLCNFIFPTNRCIPIPAMLALEPISMTTGDTLIYLLPI